MTFSGTRGTSGFQKARQAQSARVSLWILQRVGKKKTSQVFGPKMEEMPDVDHVSWIQLPLYEDGSIQKFTVGYIRLLMFGC